MSLALSLVLAAAVPLPALSGTSPDEVPSGAAIAQWLSFKGDARSPKGDGIAYELRVDPRRLALYVLTRYRVRVAGDLEAENEVLIWNSAPGTRQALRCYERVPNVGPGGTSWAWEVVPQGTNRYWEAMAMATQVYFLQRRREEEKQAER